MRTRAHTGAREGAKPKVSQKPLIMNNMINLLIAITIHNYKYIVSIVIIIVHYIILPCQGARQHRLQAVPTAAQGGRRGEQEAEGPR